MQRYSKYKESVWESGDVGVVRTRETKTAIRGEFSGICSKFEQWFNMRRRRGREDYRYNDTKFKLVSDNWYKKDWADIVLNLVIIERESIEFHEATKFSVRKILSESELLLEISYCFFFAKWISSNHLLMKKSELKKCLQ